MKYSIKKILLDTNYTFFALSLVSAFSIIGAFIIYLNPHLYSSIDYKALFVWLFYNRLPHNFWLYGVLAGFFFLGISALICTIYDIKRRNIFTLLFHICFILVLLAHLINAVISYKLPEQIIPQGKSSIIALPPPHSPIRFFLDRIGFDMTPAGYPKNIMVKLIYKYEEKEASGTLKINEPIKIGSNYVILKYIAPYLRSITFKLRSGERLLIPVLTPESSFNLDGTILEFQAHNEDMTMFKILMIEGEKKEIMIWKLGDTVKIKGVDYQIERIIPDTVGSAVVDIVYDPSMYIIFIASTIFTLVLVIRLLYGKF